MAGAAPQKKLGEYLLQLVMQLELRDRYFEDPEKTLKSSGLGPRKRKLLLSGDLKSVLKELADEYGPMPGANWTT